MSAAKIPAALSYDESYTNAMVLAQISLETYEQSAQGLFLWQAYRAVRDAERAWPARAHDLRKIAKRIKGDGERTEDVTIEPTVLDELRRRIFGYVDGMFDRLLMLDVVAEDEGNKAMRLALQIDGKKTPGRSKTLARTQEIVERVQVQYLRLLAIQDRYENPPKPPAGGVPTWRKPWTVSRIPPAKAQHIYKAVAESVKRTDDHVRHCWDEFLGGASPSIRSHWMGVVSQAEANDARLRLAKAHAASKTPRKRSRIEYARKSS